MSVLYKALQKAEKENELRQSASSEGSFDPERLTASGALKMAGGRGVAMNRLAMVGILVVGVGGGIGFLLLKDQFMSPAPVVASAPPAPPAPVLQPPPAEVAATVADGPAPQAASASGAEPVAAAAAPETSQPAPSEVAVASAPAAIETRTQDVAVAPAAPRHLVARPAAAPQRAEPMPELAANAPARMLSPPITVNRAEFALAGVGNQVQVREVGQAARSNVSAGYESLVRGSYDTALGFYDRALADEPNSVLALLGRGVALQKLGRGSEAETAYGQVLKLDPQNREALANVTAIAGERAPQDALARLLELERDYAGFSPIKAQIGLTYAKLGSMPQAQDYLRRAVALAPDAAMYHYNLALVQDHMGLREQAIASYERVLGLTSAGRGSADVSSADIERRVRFLKTR